jgi:3-(3-hydroxy-phenyl)propionate hydroxylase
MRAIRRLRRNHASSAARDGTRFSPALMQKTYTNPRFAYRRSDDQRPGSPAHHPVVIVGAGPIGLTAAIDLGVHGIRTVLLDDNDTVSVGSRAVCHSKRALEILDRLGCGQAIVDRGVGWNVGKVFFRDRKVYEFNLLPEPGHKRPAFINLQQYHFEDALVHRLDELGNVDLRWRNRVVSVTNAPDCVELSIETPDGPYRLTCDWLIAADGAKSTVREALGLDFTGHAFPDRFLIADVVMKAEFPAERWFWFDPPFHRNQSALLHRQADHVWRLDFQLGPQADPELEKMPERVIPRVRAMLGGGREFELEWVSVYTFQCRRMQRFRHGRVLFAGDAAHQVSPFGARGANSGVQDVDNLAWKLKLVLDGRAPVLLLDSYSAERGFAADENILHSTRSTDFISPKSKASRVFRDAVLTLAEHHPFARSLVNSGRLSLPSIYADSPLNTPDADAFAAGMRPGSPCADAPVGIDGKRAWLIDALKHPSAPGFIGLLFLENTPPPAAQFDALAAAPIPVRTLVVTQSREGRPGAMADVDGLAFRRYDAEPGTYYLIRPDQHVAGRWRNFDAGKVGSALARATGND